jgi:hypothetical protein
MAEAVLIAKYTAATLGPRAFATVATLGEERVAGIEVVLW